MILQTPLLENTKKFVESMLEKQLPAQYKYHNLQHTQEVVAAAQLIATKSHLLDEDQEIVLVAAWLHDAGYCRRYDNHEEESIRLARSFLEEQRMDTPKIEKVLGCIRATRYPQQPHNLLEEVVCDADMYHITLDDYFERAEQLRQELTNVKNKDISRGEWIATNREFMKSHLFFTPYGKTEMEAAKEKNIKKLKKALKEMENGHTDFRPLDQTSLMPHPAENSHNPVEEKLWKKDKKEKKKNKDKESSKDNHTPVRGIETMFRTMSVNQMELSAIADNKANIMITVNSIILSIVVSVLGRRLEEYPNFYIPTLILTLACLLTIIFAVLATRPNVTSGVFSKEDVYSKRTNLLFFGNFHSMNLDDYEWGIQEMMKDSDYLYGSMIRDNYFLGKVLGKKYRLLRVAYTIFMFGLVISFMSYIIAIVFFPM
jgi:predicted metal-dependent HD superfamily phosphohydrolase